MSFPHGDKYWQDTLKFIKKNLQNRDLILAPEEFINEMDGVLSYGENWQELIKNFQWLIIHKGRIVKLVAGLSEKVLENFNLVFGNEVFIVFCQRQISDISLDEFKQHIDSFWELFNLALTNLDRQAILLEGLPNNLRQSIYLGDYHVLTQTVYGHKIYLDTRDISLTPHILIDGYWESWITKKFITTLKPGMQVIEVGANVGYYSLIAASIIGDFGHINCFEANPIIYNLLRKSLEINGFRSRSTCINKAVTNSSSPIKFNIFRDRLGSSSILNMENVAIQFEDSLETITVESTTLDEAIGINSRVDILKIDAEGAEPLIIEGAKKMLTNNQQIKIFMEFAMDFFTDSHQAKKHLQQLLDLGFTINIIKSDSQHESIHIDELCNSNSHCELFLFRP